MVVIDEFSKIWLYERLNLGYECNICNTKYYSKFDELKHIQEVHTPPKREPLICTKCGKRFGHEQILQLHLQIHKLSDPPTPEQTNEVPQAANVPLTDVVTVSPRDTGSFMGALDNEPETLSTSQRLRSKEKKVKPPRKEKVVGLTKVKMEDCLRCDACSCIYLDKNDYDKHMKNFHRANASDSNKKKVKKRMIPCDSCCGNCRGNHTEPHKRPRVTQQAANTIFKINMRDNIKDRWMKMVSQRLIEEVRIKADPDADLHNCPSNLDLTHLLTQVEVKIKTEPEDYVN